PPGKVECGLRLGGRTLPGELHESAEGVAGGDRDLGEHLAVDLDPGLVEAVDQLRVAHALEPRGGVDAGDPEAPELALAVAAVAVCVHPRALHLLFGEAVGGMLAAVVALRFLEHLAPLLFRVDGALYPA